MTGAIERVDLLPTEARASVAEWAAWSVATEPQAHERTVRFPNRVIGAWLTYPAGTSMPYELCWSLFRLAVFDYDRPGESWILPSVELLNDLYAQMHATSRRRRPISGAGLAVDEVIVPAGDQITLLLRPSCLRDALGLLHGASIDEVLCFFGVDLPRSPNAARQAVLDASDLARISDLYSVAFGGLETAAPTFPKVSLRRNRGEVVLYSQAVDDPLPRYVLEQSEDVRVAQLYGPGAARTIEALPEQLQVLRVAEPVDVSDNPSWRGIRRLHSLRDLTIAGLGDDSIIQDIRPLGGLRGLNVSGSQISPSGLRRLETLTELVALNVGEATAPSGDAFLTAFPNLQTLTAGPGWFNDDNAAQLATGTLQAFALAGEGLGSRGWNELLTGNPIKYLFMAPRSIRAADLRSIAWPNKLFYFGFASPRLTDEDLSIVGHVAKHTEIRRLGLDTMHAPTLDLVDSVVEFLYDLPDIDVRVTALVPQAPSPEWQAWQRWKTALMKNVRDRRSLDLAP